MDEAPRQLQMFVETQTASTSRNNWTEPKNFQVLPNRLITVFGLESSGTTLIAETLAKAVGADIIELFEGLIYRTNDKGSRKKSTDIPFNMFHNLGGSFMTKAWIIRLLSI